ncbi:uncharacterized protein LOC126737582 [Anthonomus grandis grandis]|uniref:uncharacterized protein LOC126737582 n=1 Tax=Anthonomus grandis grandis TaxID=2921223 RepID=UPI0021656024|nr:uncharacterized protein LOC126737582 [Anthonomus grandis grandis]
MGSKDAEEFRDALRDISAHMVKLDCPFDRVRCAEWCRKLASLPDDNLESSKIKNEYAQFLRIQVRNKCLHGPYEHPPPENALCPLSECLGNLICKEVPFLPKMGPISPVLHHKSPDGRAYVSVKQVPGGGVLCYMAVSPDGLEL